ncbi:MAG: methyltransferase domain-containing protein [Comamonadaceae bacterium]|nr:methyltransferase domain-containing protein [Comamonadaceae bacterium]
MHDSASIRLGCGAEAGKQRATTMDDDSGWNPAQYLRFADLRLRPALDLLARVPGEPARIVDLGCGPGNATRLLAERWPRATIVGVDSSLPMLQTARRELPQLDWRCQDIGCWRPDAPVDLLYSNATLHWLADHATLFPSLVGHLAPGGTLAVQMPRNVDAPSHRAIAETARDGPWRERLAPLLTPPPVAAPADYFGWLRPRGPDARHLGDRVPADPQRRRRGQGVDQGQRAQALPRRAGAARAATPSRPHTRRASPRPTRGATDGTTLLPFRRLFIVATRAR